MTHPPDDIDRQIRETFRADGRSVTRIVRGALSAEDRPPGRGRAFAAVAGALAVAAVVLWLPGGRPATDESEPLVLSGFIDGGALVLSLPDGTTEIAWGAARDDRPPEGAGLVLAGGDVR